MSKDSIMQRTEISLREEINEKNILNIPNVNDLYRKKPAVYMSCSRLVVEILT